MDSTLAELVVARSTRPTSPLHGEQHWKAVAWAGHGLARSVEGADAELVLLFALVHDSQRFNESVDPEHGLRAAQFLRELVAEGLIDFADERVEILVDACTRHDKGEVSDHPTIGTCWDADRLNLWRVDTTPWPGLLSTEPAGDRALIAEAASFHTRQYEWADLFGEYAQLGG